MNPRASMPAHQEDKIEQLTPVTWDLLVTSNAALHSQAIMMHSSVWRCSRQLVEWTKASR